MDAQAFIKAVKHIVEEKKISEEIVWNAMELALITAYKKNFDVLTNVRVDINRETGEIKVFSLRTVVDEVTNPNTEISLEEAKEINPEIKIGEIIERSNTKNLGELLLLLLNK